MVYRSQKQEFMLSLNGGNGDRRDDPPGFRSPHRRRYPEGIPLPPSAAAMRAARGPGSRPAPEIPQRDARGRFIPRAD